MAEIKKIVIAEFARELEVFLCHCRQNNSDPAQFTILALEPQVKEACKEKGMAVIDTLPFFNSDSHRRVLIRSHELTSLIDNNLAFAVEASLNKVLLDTFIFYSRFYINNYLWIIEVMKGIKDLFGAEGAVEIVVVESSSKSNSRSGNPYLTKQDRFVHSLAEKYCRANGLKVEVIKGTGPAVVNEKRESNRWASAFLEAVARKLLQWKLRRFSRFPVVFTAVTSYNLDRVCRDIQTQFPGVLAATDMRAPASAGGYLKLCLKELKKQFTGGGVHFTGVGMHDPAMPIPVPVRIFKPKENREADKVKIKQGYETFAAAHRDQWVYENCSFRDEWTQKVETDLLDSLADLLDTIGQQETFLGYLKPRLVVSPVSTGEYQGWAEAARSLHIPALVIPQKTLVVPANEIARIEERYIGRAQATDTFTHVAAQSPLVTKYLKWAGYNGSIIETGNLIFARLEKQAKKEKAFDGKKVIVWAPSMKTRKSRRFYVLESIDELLSAMADVFEIVSRMDDVHLIFRIHPGDAITKKEIYSLLTVPDNVSVSDSGAFEEVLAVADLLISFSSTAAQEALINHIPILLYDKWRRYNHLDAEEIKDSVPSRAAAVYYIAQKDYLLSGIKWILEEHTTKKVPLDIFKEVAFLDDTEKFANFSNFVEQCIKNKPTNYTN
jgi:hypothetical protein